ncbi:MAG: agmatinase family protein [Myxococcaceae bacterium]
MSAFDPNAAAPADSGLFGLPQRQGEAEVVIVPVPFEATTSYGAGASKGPAAVLEASRQVDLFDLDTGRPYEAGIAMLPLPEEVRLLDEKARFLAAPIIEAGGVGEDAALAEVNALCGQMNEWVYQQTKTLLAAGKRVGVLGGDHSVPFGAIRALSEAFPGLGVLHLDAHADLRDAYEGFTWSHASIMHNVAHRLPAVKKLVQVGIRDLCEAEAQEIDGSGGRIVTFYDAKLAQGRFDGATWTHQVDEIVSHLPEKVYLSFDIDGLDPTLCPNTGTPVPGGLSFHQAGALLAGVVRSGRAIVGFDLCEVAPDPAGGEWDGNVGARLLYKMIGWMLRSRK